MIATDLLISSLYDGVTKAVASVEDEPSYVIGASSPLLDSSLMLVDGCPWWVWQPRNLAPACSGDDAKGSGLLLTTT